MWACAKSRGFQVVVEERNARNREKAVDTSLTAMMVKDAWASMCPVRHDAAVLVAGDRDYVPAARALKERGLQVHVLFWEHATNSKLRDEASTFTALDPFLQFLTRRDLAGYGQAA